MMVCHCHAVSDGAIRDEVAAGATDADDVAERCGAGSSCGSCRNLVEELVAETAVSLAPVAA